MPFSISSPVRIRVGHRLARLVLLMLLVPALLASGCAGEQPSVETEAGPVVVVTTSIWADVVANVACDGLVEVETIVPLGADVHGFEPSLADRADLDDAALIVANGLRLEQGLDDTITAAEDAGTPVLRLGNHVDTIAYGSFAGHDHDEDHSEGTADGVDGSDGVDGDDPHVWFDPKRVAAVLPVLADRLVADVGLDRAAVDACLGRYLDQLDDLDAEIAGRVADLPPERRLLVTNHDALGYFADRYGFEVIGTVSPASAGLAETNPAYLEALAETMERAGSRTIFAETSASTDDADALARRLGDAEVVTLFTESLSEPGGGAETYIDFLATNAERVLDALS